MTTRPPTASGLDDVVAAETALSDVDGQAGRLVIRGHRVEDLVASATFEEVCGLMWQGAMPAPAERERLRVALAGARDHAFGLIPSLGAALEATDAMEALRAAVAHLRTTGNLRDDAVLLTGAIPVFAAAWHRAREARPPVPPDGSLTHAADFLHMLSGTVPPPARVAGLDAYLCCVVDHGMNASTFVARAVASTGSDPVSAIVAAIGALKGPLHGGAPGPVLDMLDAIGQPERARAWLEGELAAGRRIMGMGHRIYRVRDPRAAALERAASALEHSGAATERLLMARSVEREAERLLAERHPERHLKTNVEFYTAVLLEAVGIPRTLFSPTFAASRVVGWCAHVEEQRRVGRLIRPASRYVGPAA
ncbi:MAG: citrate synthase/methylcitrate synthase [Acidobacteria bacterium]|nr:MAG: citrate synthase/methylcitrate synthase [Acidobacteriota bacterium]